MNKSFVIFDFRNTTIAWKKISDFVHNTNVQDAPGGAENARCNRNKWQLCLRGNYRQIFGSWFSDVNGMRQRKRRA